MKAARFYDYGPPEIVVIEEVEPPRPGPKQVLVAVKAAGVNPIDVKYRRGLMRDVRALHLPHIGGFDFAGVIREVGTDVTDFSAGQEVFGRGVGTFAEYAVASAAKIAEKPPELSFEAAATIPIGAGTAWAALFDGADLQAGQRILIHGAAGGVGHWATQLAHWKRAHVYATVSTKNVDQARSLGADEVIDYTAARFEQQVSDLDAVLDTVGGDIGVRSLPVIKRGGVFVTIAATPPEEAAAEHGIRIGQFVSDPGTALLREIAALVSDGSLHTEIGQTFPLADIVQAQTAVETGHGRGRVVLTIG